MTRELTAGPARVVVDAGAGGRVASLQLAGRELLVTDRAGGPLSWGLYPMVPWAGRLRHGRFRHAGRTVEMDRDHPPHAIHGLGYRRPWDHDGDELRLRLRRPWPFGGEAVQRFALDEQHLALTLEVHATDRPFPAQVGWHPWFRRRLDGAAPVELGFRAASMYELDDEAIPTGALGPVATGPWDNCFTGVEQPVVLRWPGFAIVELRSDADHWVAFTEPDHAVCVEPQTGPPDGFNSGPQIVEPGSPLVATFEIRWTLDPTRS